ncbi:hypothetical protein [Ekhidna sp.]
MKEFEKIESLLKTKAYHSLTADEKAIVDAELGQDTYEELRNGITQIASEQIKVRKDVKASLMTEFKQQERRGIFALIQFKLPAYTHAFSLAIIIYVIFFMPKAERVVTQNQIVEVMVRDTIEIRQVDTLFVEKVVKVPTPVFVAQEVESEKPIEIKQVSNRSISEQKEVMDLVVRGLD